MSQLGQFNFTDILSTLTGNTGDIVHPQVGNINIVGSGLITTNGNNTTGTITIAGSGAIGASFPTDSGTAIPALNVLNVYGGDNINTVGSGNSVTIHLDTSIVLPVTNASGTQGLYSLGANRFMHNIGTLNTFLGQSSGVLSLTVLSAVNNVGLGANCLTSIATSSYTTAAGANCLTLLTGGANNVAYGAGAGSALLTGSNNVLISKDAGSAYTGSESSNICIGHPGIVATSNRIYIGQYGTGAGQQDTATIAGIVHATNGLVADAGNVSSTAGSVGAFTTVTAGTDLVSTAGNLKLPTTSSTIGQIQINAVRAFHTFGTYNTFAGQASGNFTLTPANASYNTAIGSETLQALVGTGASQGYANTACGAYALTSLQNGAACIALGFNAGSAYTSTESSNITIGSLGVVAESNTTRLGGGTGATLGLQNKCYISGINGVTVSNVKAVTINSSTDQLGTADFPTYMTWSEVTGTTQAAAVNSGYITNNGSLVTVTMPSTAAVGERVSIAGKGTGLWKLAQNAGQTIHFGSRDTTAGAGGYLAATVRYDCVDLICITANTDFVVKSSVGTITVV